MVYDNPQAPATSSTVGGAGGLAPTPDYNLVIPQEGIAFAGLEHPSSRIPPTITSSSAAAAGSTSRGLAMPASTMTPPLPQPPLRHVVVVGLPNTATA